MENKEEVISAVQSGDAPKLRNLLSRDPSLASTRDAGGVSALMHALYRRQQEIASLIVAAHPSLDIFETTSTGKLDQLSKLLDGDSSLVNSYSADGFTALHFAAFFAQAAAAKILLQLGASVTAVANNPTKVMPLHSATAGRSNDVVVLLLEHGAPVHAKQQHGWTPLHSAAQNGDPEMVNLLMQYGADANATNDSGVTPIQIARDKGHGEVLNILEKGAARRTRSS